MHLLASPVAVLLLVFGHPVNETFCLFQSMRAREFYQISAQNNLQRAGLPRAHLRPERPRAPRNEARNKQLPFPSCQRG